MKTNTRNAIIRGGGALLLCFGVIAAMGASLMQVQEARAFGHQVTRTVLTDGSIAMRIKAVAAEHSLTITSGDLIFQSDGSANTADASMSDGTTTAGTLDTNVATADTYGELCDLIDADANYECELVDALPSWSCDGKLSTLAETSESTGLSSSYNLDGSGIYADAGLAITMDTSDMDKASAAISVSYTDNDLLAISDLNDRCAMPDGTGRHWRSELNKAVFNGTVTTGAPDVKIWLVKKTSAGLWAGATEQLLWQATGVDDETDVTVSFADLPALVVPRDCHIVAVYDDTTTADMTTQRITVHGLAWQE